MRTTVDISDALLRELRLRAQRQGRSFRLTLEETLQRGLAAPPLPTPKLQIKSYPVGIKPAYRGLSMNQLYDQIEAEDSGRRTQP